MALPKREKLKSRAVFTRLHRLRVLANNEHLKIYAQARRSAPAPADRSGTEDKLLPQVAFVVRKKELKSAVQRNRLRRRFEEAYRIQRTDWPSLKRWQALVCMLHPPGLQLSFVEIEDLLRRTFGELSPFR